MRLLSTAVSALAIALLASPGVRADDRCTSIEQTIETWYAFKGCTSPVGICTTGRIGPESLGWTTSFTALSVRPGPAPDTMLYTGQLVITTPSGTVTLNDYGFLNTDNGRFFEVERVVSGTDAYAGATGMLTSHGMATGTGFAGEIEGAICPARRSFDEEQDRE